MYQRIMNRLDAELLAEELQGKDKDSVVIKRMRELAGILDDRYGVVRGSADMGGYILFFPDSKTYGKCYPHITEFYHLQEELFEYSQRINGKSASGVEWWEELYLLSSDDALVLIHPKKSVCHADREGNRAEDAQKGRLE